MMRGILHCYYNEIYGIHSIEPDLRSTVVWSICCQSSFGINKRPNPAPLPSASVPQPVTITIVRL